MLWKIENLVTITIKYLQSAQTCKCVCKLFIWDGILETK